MLRCTSEHLRADLHELWSKIHSFWCTCSQVQACLQEHASSARALPRLCHSSFTAHQTQGALCICFDTQITPVLVGSAKSQFADTVRTRLQAAWPRSLLLTQFLGPAELAELYSCTRLNFHPCTYDAYGMTIVEAASQGGITSTWHLNSIELL